MTNEQLIEIYDPANVGNLTDEQVADMQKLTDEQIAVLARAFPNKPRGNGYLILYDKDMAANKQLYPLSTWQNLYHVRVKASKNNLVPFTFASLLVKKQNQSSNTAHRITPKQVVDLTHEEVANELKMNAAATAPIPAAIPETGITKETSPRKPTKDETPQAGKVNKEDDIPVVDPKEAEAELKKQIGG